MYVPKTYTNTINALAASDLNRIEQELLFLEKMRGEAPFDSFLGADDDAKLVNAMSYAGAQTYVPYITFGNRRHILNDPIGQPYDGFAMRGPGAGWLNAEKNLFHGHIELNCGAANFIDIPSGEAWNYFIEGLSFTGDPDTQFIRTGSTAILWASTFRNLYFGGIKSVFGNSSEKLITDLITIDGQWEILNTVDMQANIGGADNRGIFKDGGNFGQGSTAAPGAGKYMFQFGGHSKADIGPMYITADNGWRGIKFTGSLASGYGQTLRSAIIEGRNATDPCDGNLIRVEGGCVTLRDCSLNSGMAAPLSSEHGFIEVINADTQVLVDGANFSHASGVAITTPVVYSSVTGTGRVRVTNAFHHTRPNGPSWGTQKPVIAGTLISGDDSVTGP